MSIRLRYLGWQIWRGWQLLCRVVFLVLFLLISFPLLLAYGPGMMLDSIAEMLKTLTNIIIRGK